MNKYSFIN